MSMILSSLVCIDSVLKQTRDENHNEDKKSENNIVKMIILLKWKCKSSKKDWQWSSANVKSVSDFIAMQSSSFHMSKSDTVMRYL